MEILNWYNHIMGNNIVLVIGVIFSVVAINLWEKQEKKWKSNNNYGMSKKIIKVIGIALIAVFGLPGIFLFFSPK